MNTSVASRPAAGVPPLAVVPTAPPSESMSPRTRRLLHGPILVTLLAMRGPTCS